jgi:hypothetical protein
MIGCKTIYIQKNDCDYKNIQNICFLDESSLFFKEVDFSPRNNHVLGGGV